MNTTDTICSISTPQGIGAIAVIRVSGKDAFKNVAGLLKNSGQFLDTPHAMAKYSEIYDNNQLIDQVVITKFMAPHSYTAEDLVEISCHGSLFIQKKIIELLINHGCRLAEPGEFTMRAFMNGKMDLPQAEAIADLIESQSETSHKLAVNQLRGNFSDKIRELRAQFIEFASLLELELDFSEEDVQFADRAKLRELLHLLKEEVTSLIRSFKLGNVLKTGIPVALVGKPNVGKSTLLNTLLEEDRAIVSEIPGTTRDTIEDVFHIQGIPFRFIDTAGIRTSKDEIENFGIERTFKAIEKADIILYIIDINKTTIEEVEAELLFFENEIDMADKKLIIIANKIDELAEMPHHFTQWDELDIVYISAKRKVNIPALEDMLVDYVNEKKGLNTMVLTNSRHYDIMLRLNNLLDSIENGMQENIATDLLAIEIRNALHYLGLVTGEISTDEILNSIFGRFCIGK